MNFLAMVGLAAAAGAVLGYLAFLFTPATRFANPWLACEQCGKRVIGFVDKRLFPCRHRGDTRSLCPSWGPVDGCTCGIEHEWPA